MAEPYSVPLWRHPTRADVNILTKERDDAERHAGETWECMDMGRETVAAILGDNKEHIAPMFIPEAIRTACYRAATGTLRDEVMPPDAASRRVTALEAELEAALNRNNALFQTLKDCESIGQVIDALKAYTSDTAAFVAAWNERRTAPTERREPSV